jgi:hypothetical protein
MEPLDFETLHQAAEHPHRGSRGILFAGLASARAGWRARAAESLLRLYSRTEPSAFRALGRPFGESADAIFTPALDDLRARIDEPASEAWKTFAASTPMTFDAWHDGESFDLTALLSMPLIEQNLVRQWLHTKLSDAMKVPGFREMEAAAALDETDLLKSLARHEDADIRLRARDLLKNPDDIANELCGTLARSRHEEDVLRALDLVPSHATPEVRAALVKRVSKVDGTFINSAMVLLETFGGVKDAWNERPFLFRIQSEGARGPLLKELIARVAPRAP